MSHGAHALSPSSFPDFDIVVHVAYRSPFGAAAAAGKLFTRKAVFRSGELSVNSEMATGLLQLAPPSVDLTM